MTLVWEHFGFAKRDLSLKTQKPSQGYNSESPARKTEARKLMGKSSVVSACFDPPRIRSEMSSSQTMAETFTKMRRVHAVLVYSMVK